MLGIEWQLRLLGKFRRPTFLAASRFEWLLGIQRWFERLLGIERRFEWLLGIEWRFERWIERLLGIERWFERRRDRYPARDLPGSGPDCSSGDRRNGPDARDDRARGGTGC